MNIHLAPITRHNFHECLRLHVGRDQHHFVASNAASIVQAYVEPAFIPRAIYADDRMVGFVMYGRDPETGIDWIVRLMVDVHHQGRGYGRAGLLLALEVMRGWPDFKAINVSYRPEDLAAARLYASVGFVVTGELRDGELVAEHRPPRAGAAPRVAALVLAAGASERMGRPKQLLDWGGQPLVRVAAMAALSAGLYPVLAVVGSAGAEVAAALAGLPLQIVANPNYATGQSSSLRMGITALPPKCLAVLVLLSDQPFVTPAIVAQLAEAWRTSGSPIVAPVYAGQRGNPVLFDRSMFAELLAIDGDQGARALLAANPARVHLVPFDDDRPLADIDTPGDYERLSGY